MFPSYVSRSCNNRVSNPILESCNKGIYSLYGALSYIPALFPQEHLIFSSLLACVHPCLVLQPCNDIYLFLKL
ncbi:hypothetical protein IMY05_013G0030000 [Salix suchowensis]|nr:hypothetical protein IMY05_013G0030000 [Salix suchowensis]